MLDPHNHHKRPASEMTMYHDKNPNDNNNTKLPKASTPSIAISLKTTMAAHERQQLEFGHVLKRAQNGDADAQTQLGVWYATGTLGAVAQDWTMAARYWRQAAAQGHPRALCALAHLYQRGIVVENDNERMMTHNDRQREAVRLYRTAATAPIHDAHAQYQLGLCYAQGAGGLALDQDMALSWWEAAARQGHRDAKRKLRKAARRRAKAASAAATTSQTTSQTQTQQQQQQQQDDKSILIVPAAGPQGDDVIHPSQQDEKEQQQPESHTWRQQWMERDGDSLQSIAL